MAGTRFLADPVEELAVPFLTLVLASSPPLMRGLLPQLVYQALVA